MEGYDRNGCFTDIDFDQKGTEGPIKIRQTPSLAVRLHLLSYTIPI